MQPPPDAAVPAIPVTISPIPTTKARDYVLVVLVVVLVCSVISVGLILTRPGSDNTPLILTIVGFGSSLVAAISAFLKGDDNQRAIQEVHLSLNSRLTEWMVAMHAAAEAKAAAAMAEGKAAGKAEEKAAVPDHSAGGSGLVMTGTVEGTVEGTVAPQGRG